MIDEPRQLGRSTPDDRKGEVRPGEIESTEILLARMRAGDAGASEALFRRCLPVLRRWARGRLPPSARDLADTEDLVQDTLINALRRMEAFECRGEGALQAYLRQALANRVRDEVRRAHRRPAHDELAVEAVDRGATPLEQAIGRENVERYESALRRLKAADREAVIGRLELQMNYDELAAATGRPTANAARVAAIRAVQRLIEEMRHGT
jgi:RNA polymerase sigma-70 factor (ECF subfamily)